MKKEYKNVEDILTRLNDIEQQMKEMEEEKDELKSRLQVKNESPEPRGFDYKKAVMSVFLKDSDNEFSINDIVSSIANEHNFSPDKTKVANRINYLTDRDAKLERVEGKRGFYRLTSEGRADGMFSPQ